MILFHRTFKKAYFKRDVRIRKKFDERVYLFVQDPIHPTLKNHPLHGKWLGYRSINVTGDFRAVFKQEGELTTFVDIDTHANLYSS
jgi:addiction module RelE/StbE family toxin